MLANIGRIARARVERRRQYARLIAEIRELSQRELTDMGADRRDMLRQVYLDFYGK